MSQSSEHPSSLITSIPGVGAILLVVFALFGLPMAGTRKQPDEASKEGAASGAADPDEEARPVSPGSAEEYLRAAGVLASDGRRAAPGVTLNYLVVTLPDPVKSRLGVRFDLEVDAVTRGGVAAGYALDGHWFPWHRPAGSAEAKAKPVDLDKQPGVLLYRNRENRLDRLVVLVVGEDAVTGLRVGAAKTAFDLAYDSGRPGPLRVVGPGFSGSQASLARAVLEWADAEQDRARAAARDTVAAACGAALASAAGPGRGGAERLTPAPTFRVVSGGATALSPWKEVDPKNAPRLVELCGKKDQIELTRIPLNSLRQATLRYLSAPGRVGPDKNPADPIPAVRYASLVEVNTGFGAASSKVVSPAADKKHPHPAAGAPAAVPGPQLILRFPIHVGRAVSILSRTQREHDEQLGLLSPEARRLARLEQDRAGVDALPAADEGRTAAANLLRLNQFWEHVRGERVRYVEVIATDAEDTLFLTRLLRENCPNVVPVTYGFDSRFAHPSHLPFTRGMIVAGTYPHRLAAQARASPEGDGPWRGAFGIDGAQGVYNAVLVQLEDVPRPDTPRRPDEMRRRMLDYAAPGAAEGTVGRPPVWVSAVGEGGGLVPLAYFPNYPDLNLLAPGATRTAAAAAPPPPHAPALRWLVVAVGLAAAAIAAAGWRAYRRAAARPRRGAPVGAVGDGPASVVALADLYAALTAGGLFFAGLPLVVYFVVVYGHGGPAGSAWDAATNAGAAAVAGAVLLAGLGGVGAVLYSWAGRLYGRRAAGVAVAGAALAVTVALWVGILATYQMWERGVGWGVAAEAVVLAAAAVGLVVWLRGVRRRSPAWVGADGLTPLVCLATGVVCAWFAADAWRVDPARWWLSAERAANLDSGASPLVPALVFAVGFALYGVLGLRLTRDLADVWAECPYPDPAAAAGDGDPVRAITDAGKDLRGLVAHPTRVFWLAADRPRRRARGPLLRRVRVDAVAALGVVALAGLMVMVRVHPTWEARAWNCLFATGFVGLAYLTVVCAYRFYLVWKGVEATTRAVMAVPMVAAFDRLPDKLARVLGEYVLAARWRRFDRAILEHVRARTVAAVRAAAAGLNDPHAAAAWTQIRPWVAAGQKAAPAADESDDRAYSARLTELAELSRLLVGGLGPVWAHAGQSTAAAFGTVPVKAGEEGPEPKTWVDWAEQFVAVMAVVYVSQFFVRMRRLAWMAAAASGALLTAATAYQFQPERLVMTAGVGVAGVVAALTMWVLYRLNKNEFVSRVCRSTPNRFSLDSAFVQNVATLVLPLVLVIVVQFAGRTRAVVEPVLGWFR